MITNKSNLLNQISDRAGVLYGYSRTKSQIITQVNSEFELEISELGISDTVIENTVKNVMELRSAAQTSKSGYNAN